MGGIGSGEYERNFKRKMTVEECLKVDVYDLLNAREGLNEPLPLTSRSVAFVYKSADTISFLLVEINAIATAEDINEGLDELSAQWRSEGTSIEVFHGVTRVTRFGIAYPLQLFPVEKLITPVRATSYWFRCTAQNGNCECGKRCRRLYLRNKRFACRQCHNLAYESQRVVPEGRWYEGFHRRMVQSRSL